MRLALDVSAGRHDLYQLSIEHPSQASVTLATSR